MSNNFFPNELYKVIFDYRREKKEEKCGDKNVLFIKASEKF